MATRLDAEALPANAKSPHRRSTQQMLRGPIPIVWLQSAAQLPGKSLHAGLALWIAATFARTWVVPLSNLDGMRLGCGRNQKYRALAWLETAGFIEVQRQLGRSPLVTLLPGTQSPSTDDEAVKRSGMAKASVDGVRNQSSVSRRQRGGSGDGSR